MSHKDRVVNRVDFALIVTSDRIYKGEAEDKITPMVRNLLATSNKFRLVYSIIVPNNYDLIKSRVEEGLSKADVIIITGGTGVSSKDLIIKIVDSFNGYDLPGFGELFRVLSWKQVGARAWLSRAKARVVHGKVLFALPGSPDAVRLALEKLILPVIDHLIWELRH